MSTKFEDDARHVAICTVHRVNHLVSWNFKHLVNVRRSACFNAVNLLQGYSPVSIVNPKEFNPAPTTKTFDAVEMSRHLREQTSRKLATLSREKQLALLNAHISADSNAASAAALFLRENPPEYGGDAPK